MRAATQVFGMLALGTILVGCVSSPRFTASRTSEKSNDESYSTEEEGMASYYADEFNGRSTSNGETYNMNDLTAAHRTLPFNTKVLVTNMSNGKTVVVRINDRGPFKDDRIIDLSLAAAKQINMIGPGTAKVNLKVIELGPTGNGVRK